MLLLHVVNWWVIPLIILTFFCSWIIQRTNKLLPKLCLSFFITMIGFVLYVFLEKGLVEIIKLGNLTLSTETLWLINLMIVITASGLAILLLFIILKLPAPPTLREKLEYLGSLTKRQ